MNAKLLIPVFAGMLFTLSAQAHDCSGGQEGGMDSTGNACNNEAVVTTDAAASRSTPASSPATKVQTTKAASGSKNTAKRTVAARQPSARSQSKQG